nr:MAG: nonstructural protein [Microvirus sp.]
MIDQIFTVYDEKAKAHLPPFQMNRSEMAIRTFTDCINSKEHQFSQHPSDYTLFHHGSFDNLDASFNLMSHPKPLGNGVQFIQIPNNEQIPDEEQSDTPLRLHAEGGNTT